MSADATSRVDNLHRIHAGVASGKGGNSVDIGASRWRGEAGGDDKREVARRIAVTWNVCEGWPTEALEAGCLREVDEAARALLKELGGLRDPARVSAAATRLREAFAVRDPQQDMTDGRPHDCTGCGAPGLVLEQEDDGDAE